MPKRLTPEEKEKREEEAKKKKEEAKKKKEEAKKKKELEKKKKEMAKKLKAAATYKDKHKTVNLIVGTPKAKGKQPKAPRLGGGGRGGGGGGGGRGKDYSAAGLVGSLLAQQSAQQQYASSQAKNQRYQEFLEKSIQAPYGGEGMLNLKLRSFLKEKGISEAAFRAAQRKLSDANPTGKNPSEKDIFTELEKLYDLTNLNADYEKFAKEFEKTPEWKEYVRQKEQRVEDFNKNVNVFTELGYSKGNAIHLQNALDLYRKAGSASEKQYFSDVIRSIVLQELKKGKVTPDEITKFLNDIRNDNYQHLEEINLNDARNYYAKFSDLTREEEKADIPPVKIEPGTEAPPVTMEEEVPPTSPLPSGTSGPPPLFPTAPEPAFPGFMPPPPPQTFPSLLPPPPGGPIIEFPPSPALGPQQLPPIPPIIELPPEAEQPLPQVQNIPELLQIGYQPLAEEQQVAAPLPPINMFLPLNPPAPAFPQVIQPPPDLNIPPMFLPPPALAPAPIPAPVLQIEPAPPAVAEQALVPFGGGGGGGGGGGFAPLQPVVPYAGPRTRGRGSRLNEPLTYYDPTNPQLPAADIGEGFIIPYEENALLAGLKRTMRGDREPRQVEGQPMRAYHRVEAPVQEQLPLAFGGGGGGGGPQLEDLPELIFEGEGAGGGGGGGGGVLFPMTSDY